MTGFTEIAAAGPVLTAFGVCVLAGLVSFASPCVVPLVPGYLSYLAAVVGVEQEPRQLALRTARLRVVGAAALFVAGFTLVFSGTNQATRDDPWFVRVEEYPGVFM